MIKYLIISLMGIITGGWLMGVIRYLWDLSRPIDLVVLILSWSLLITQSCIIWFRTLRPWR